MAPTPQLSTTLLTFSADEPASWAPTMERARVADEAGIDRLVVSDHVVFGERLEEYGRPEVGGIVGGKQPTGPDGHWLEPLTVLTYLAATTSRVRLGTNILIAALRRPVILAKQAATLDVLSGGRLDLGVGVGWQKEEYDAAGLDFDGRGRLLDHTVEVCQTIWRNTRADYRSDELSFEHIHSMPKPAQDGGVPIWVSGTVNPRVIRRIAAFATGWIPWGPAARDLPAAIAAVKDGVAAAGRDGSDLQVVGTLPVVKGDDGVVDLDRTMEVVPALRDAGVTDFRAGFAWPANPRDALDDLSAFVAAFRAAAAA
jgi:probable F420-dependent oxidoreductase